jgi:type IX secretion system PorP/SprF family membrane protein
MFKRIITVIIILLLSLVDIKSQDIHFSQHYSNLVRLNPAFTGISRCSVLSLSYRNQWTGINNAYNTYSATYQQFLYKLHSGIGFSYFKNNEGNNAFSQNNFDAIYSFHFKAVRKTFIAIALQATYFTHRISSQNQIFSDMIDLQEGISDFTSEPIVNQKFKILDFSTGIIFYNQKYYWGAAIYHIKKINISSMFYILPTKYTLHFGAKYKFDKSGNLKTDFEFSPNIIIVQQSQFQEINIGLYFYKDIFTFGIWDRMSIFPYVMNDAVIFILGTNFNRFKLGYSYDFTTSKLLRTTYGSHEITLSFKFNCSEKIKGKNTISCPSF